jgi:hypothetical protein
MTADNPLTVEFGMRALDRMAADNPLTGAAGELPPR